MYVRARPREGSMDYMRAIWMRSLLTGMTPLIVLLTAPIGSAQELDGSLGVDSAAEKVAGELTDTVTAVTDEVAKTVEKASNGAPDTPDESAIPTLTVERKTPAPAPVTEAPDLVVAAGGDASKSRGSHKAKDAGASEKSKGRKRGKTAGDKKSSERSALLARQESLPRDDDLEELVTGGEDIGPPSPVGEQGRPESAGDDPPRAPVPFTGAAVILPTAVGALMVLVGSILCRCRTSREALSGVGVTQTRGSPFDWASLSP
jgi:hypothetical protein